MQNYLHIILNCIKRYQSWNLTQKSRVTSDCDYSFLITFYPNYFNFYKYYIIFVIIVSHYSLYMCFCVITWQYNCNYNLKISYYNMYLIIFISNNHGLLTVKCDKHVVFGRITKFGILCKTVRTLETRTVQ